MKKQKIIHFTEIDSTQDYAKEITKKSVAGTIILAEKQTRGRGQFERSWSSSKGGLYFSVILKPKIKPQKIPLITYEMALAIASTLKKIIKKNYSVFIKLPNDVMVRWKMEDGRWKIKKVAGILTESSICCNKTEWVVVGVGVNINNKIPENLKGMAISLKEIIKKDIDCMYVFNKIIKNFKKYLD